MRRLVLKPIALLAATIIISAIYASISVYVVESKVAESKNQAISTEDRVLSATIRSLYHQIVESGTIIEMVKEVKDVRDAIFLIDKTFGLLGNSEVALVRYDGTVFRSWGIQRLIPNFADRQYFVDAINKGRGINFSVGPYPDSDGIVIAEPVTFKDTKLVILVKTSKEIFQESLSQFAQARKFYVLDDLGVVYLNTAEPSEMYRIDIDRPEILMKIIQRYPLRPIHLINFKNNNQSEILLSRDFMSGQILLQSSVHQIETKRIQNYMLVLIVYLFGLFLVIALITISVVHAKYHGDT